MAFSLKQMRYIAAVADTGHFGKAAEACNISQPALSQQVQAAEHDCGTPLFDRLKSGARLTPFGQEFVARARQVLNEADLLEALMRRGMVLKDEARWQKASTWVLKRDKDGFTDGRYLPPPA